MTQKAVLLEKAKTSVILVNDHPIPEPGEQQIQVKVSVAALNGHDQKVRDLGLFLSQVGTPAILANDVVGTVSKLGKSVTSFQKGDRVVSQAEFSRGCTQNGLQEYAVLHEQFTAKIPDNTSDDDAATLPTNVIATVVALFHDLPIPAPWMPGSDKVDHKSTSLLIVGGGSIAGRYAVQLAKIAGIGQIVVVGGNESELKSYGATRVIDRHASQQVILERIRSVVGDELVFAYDVVNMPEGQLLALNALSSYKKGYFTRLLPMKVDESQVKGKNAGFEIKGVLGSSSERPDLCSGFWKSLPGYLTQVSLVPVKGDFEIASGLSAESVNKILDDFRDGKRVKHAHVHL